MTYIKRLFSTLIVAGVLSLVSLCEYLQMIYIHAGSIEPDILRTIASTAYMDLLLASMCVSAYAFGQLYRMFHDIRATTASYGSTGQDDTTAQRDNAIRIVCLATPADCEGLAFRDKCRLYRVQAEQAQIPAPPTVIYLTPVMLWCNIYAVSTAMFVIGYSIHGGHPMASAVMVASMSASAIVYSMTEFRSLSAVQFACRIVSGMFLTISVILVVVSLQSRSMAPEAYSVTTGNATISTTLVIESLWLSQILPAIAPITLCLCRFSADQKHVANITAPAVVSIALPFICALSVCYLSVYTPLHAAWLDMHISFIGEWLHGNQTIQSSIEYSRIHDEWMYLILMWVLGPIITWGLYVTIVAGFLRVYKMQACASAVVFVMAVRQHLIFANDSVSDAAIWIAVATLFITPCISPPSVQEDDSVLQQLDILFQDSDESDAVGASEVNG